MSTSRIREQVTRITLSKYFRHAESLCAFLVFTVERAIQRPHDRIRENDLGIEVFKRGIQFDPKLDPIVRVQARVLRKKLAKYYQNEGSEDPILIEYPKGHYLPLISPRIIPSKPGIPISDVRKAGPRHWRVLAAAGALAILSGFIFHRWMGGPAPAPPLSVAQITFDPGWTSYPALSNDGQLLAYSSDRAEPGNTDIWVQSLVTGEAHRLTRHESSDTMPDFSPDATTIVFRSYRDGGGIYTVSLLNGAIRKLANGGYSPRVSPRGGWVVYAGPNGRGASSLFAISILGGVSVELTPAARNARCPLWTPDGENLIFVDDLESPSGEHSDWFALPFDESRDSLSVRGQRLGAFEVLQTQGLASTTSIPCPSDWLGAEVLFSAKSSGKAQLWSTPIQAEEWRANRPARQILPGPGVDYARTRRGGGSPMLAFVDEVQTSGIYSWPLDETAVGARSPLKLLIRDESLRQGLNGTRPQISEAEDRVVFSNSRAGTLDIWLLDLKSGAQQLVAGGPLNEDNPFISPDGRAILYTQSNQLEMAVYFADIEAGSTRKVMGGIDKLLDWSRDGSKALVSTGRHLSVLDVHTGEISMLLNSAEHQAVEASFSPDAKKIAVSLAVTGKDRLEGFVAPLTNPLASFKDWIRVTDEPFLLSLHWSLQGNRIYFFSTRDSFRCLWRQRLSSSGALQGPATPVRHFHNYQLYPWSGSWIGVGRHSLLANLSDTHSNIFTAEWKIPE